MRRSRWFSDPRWWCFHFCYISADVNSPGIETWQVYTGRQASDLKLYTTVKFGESLHMFMFMCIDRYRYYMAFVRQLTSLL